MEINIEKLHATNNKFYDNAAVFREDNRAAPDDNAEILRELQSVRERLAKTEPMIAKAVADLEKAVKANDKPAIAEQLANFASGAAKGVIAGVASKALLSWMGIA